MLVFASTSKSGIPKWQSNSVHIYTSTLTHPSNNEVSKKKPHAKLKPLWTYLSYNEIPLTSPSLRAPNPSPSSFTVFSSDSVRIENMLIFSSIGLSSESTEATLLTKNGLTGVHRPSSFEISSWSSSLFNRSVESLLTNPLAGDERSLVSTGVLAKCDSTGDWRRRSESSPLG